MAGPRILVVDDNAELLTLLSSSFEEWGYEVHTATRGRAALELARRFGRIDVPVIAYGTPQVGVLLGPELGCRRFDAFDSELDLGALCLPRR